MLKTTIYVPVVLVLAISLSMVVGMDYHRAKQLLQTSLLENQILLAREVGSLVNASIKKSAETAHIYARMPLVRGILANTIPHAGWAKSEVEAIIQASVELREDIDNIIIFDTKGDAYISSSVKNINVSLREYFQRAMRGESTIDTVIGMATGKRLLFYITPIYSEKNIVGASYVSFDIRSLNKVWSSFLKENKGYIVRIVSQDGTILVSSSPKENNSLNIAQLPAAATMDGVQESPIPFEDQGQRIGIWMPVEGTDWKILVSLDRGRSLAPLGELLRDSIAGNILAGLLVLCVMFFLLQKLIKKVRDIEARSRDDLLKAKAELEVLVDQRTEALNEQNVTLDRQRKSLDKILQTCPVGISVATPSGTVLYQNAELFDIFHYSQGDSPKKFYLHQKDKKRISDMLRQDIAVRNVPVPMLDANGNPLHILVSASRIHYEGQEAELR